VTAADFGERFVGQALDLFGGLDIIVNNAGYTDDALIGKQRDDQFQAMLDVHVTAPFRILRAAAEPIRDLAMRDAAEGREVIRKVVNVSSIAGAYGNAGQINYASAKAAVIGMTKTLSKEWARFKVCANCVAFGFIDTRLTRSADDQGADRAPGDPVPQRGIPTRARDALLARIPLGRPGSAEEAAGSIYLLCAPESDYVTGQVLIVAGGLAI
jgi:3-oxoacyl-[acyl-carrier protein] reductase